MSKKVAQLTKVIYLLNTKNDEHAFEASLMNWQMEEQLEEVWKDAQAKLAIMKERVDNKASAEAAAAGGSAAKALDDLRRQHDAERKAATAKMQQVRDQSQANEQTIRNQNKDRIDAMKKEIEEAKNQVRQWGHCTHE